MMERATSVRRGHAAQGKTTAARDKASKWVSILVSVVFVTFCLLLLALWHINVLNGWLVVAFVVLIGAMLLCIGFFMYVMAGTSVFRTRSHDAGCGVCSPDQYADTDTAPLPVGFDGVQAVYCRFKSRQTGVFRVRCYNTNCPCAGCLDCGKP